MSNLEMMKRRLEYQGGIKQENRMIMDKYRTFLRSLEYSYQAADIQLAQHYDDCLSAIVETQFVGPTVRALINPDKVKQDYDDKILSIDYKHGIGPGDIFYWVGTQSYWIVYLEELTEDAYFRGEIRRCRYKIKFKDREGKWHATWAAIRGPVETQINSIQKNQIRVDRPNLSLNIVLPRNEKTLHAFNRYNEFLFAGKCWQVKAPDTISLKNVIEIAAEEYYTNRATDDIMNDMKNGLIIEEREPVPESSIIGETWIKPYIEYEYKVEDTDGVWSLEDNVNIEVVKATGNSIRFKWPTKQESRFTLVWTKGDTKYKKLIIVEPLF